jgi:hypothetical protein
MQEQELFQQYELRGWQFSPRLYKILGASAIINVLAFFLMAQSNFLTGKTCDSPLASGVCSVLDALYLGSEIADGRYVDNPYMKTELEDADITFVEFSEPFKYPEGYFATANPEQMASVIDPTMIPPMDMNGFPNSTNPTIVNPGGTGDIMNTKPITPTQNENPVVNGLPNSIMGGNNPTITRKSNRKNNRNNTVNTITPNNNTVAENDTDKTEDVKPAETEVAEEVKINKQVMRDFGNMVKAKMEKEQVDISKPFKVVVEGALTKDGKLDTSIDKKTKKPKSQFTFTEGDPQMVEVAKEALEAVGDSGWLGYLRNYGAENVKITFYQDQDKIFAVVESETKTEEKASSLASGLRALISTTKMIGKLGEDETILLEGAKPPTSKGKLFMLNFEIPKQKAREIIDRNIKKANEANQNSTAQTENTEQKTSK